MELTVHGLTKQYKDKPAVDRVELRLTEGINGLLGANGAGKTTLMRMLCGILKPTAGSIALDGVDVSSEDYRAVLGYLPQDFGYYPDFTGLDLLLYLAGAVSFPCQTQSKGTAGIGVSQGCRKKEDQDLFRRNEATIGDRPRPAQ